MKHSVSNNKSYLNTARKMRNDMYFVTTKNFHFNAQISHCKHTTVVRFGISSLHN